MARQARLDEIIGREYKIVARFVEEQPQEEDLALLRHYEQRRHKVYEKLRKVLEKNYGRNR